MKPTPEIIELARKLYAAGYRKEIEQGGLSKRRQRKQLGKRRGYDLENISDCIHYLGIVTGISG